MSETVFRDWMAHLCGLCLALRDEHGHRARLVTNYDGLLVSVLTEAQEPEASPRRKAGPCALRGFRGAQVVEARAEGARLAASVSLLLAAGRTRDHIADGDGMLARKVPAALAERVSAGWDRAGGRTAADLSFDATTLREAVARQTVLENTPGLPLLALLEPTETAVAAAFAHTAVLAGRPGNAAPLAEAGRFFGRLAHLLDAVEDLPEDHATGAFNPLLATGTSLREARRCADDARRGLRLALAEVDFASRELVDALFGGETRRAVQRAFDGHPFSVFDDLPWTPDADPSQWVDALAALHAAPRKGHGHGHAHGESCAHHTPKSPSAALAEQAEQVVQIVRIDGSVWTPAVAPTGIELVRRDPAKPGDGVSPDGISAHYPQEPSPQQGRPYPQGGYQPSYGTPYQQGVPGAGQQAGGYPPPPPPPHGPYPPPGAPLPPPFRPRRPNRPGCGFDLCLSGALIGCTCGLWRPEWSEYHAAGCTDRCACTRMDCSGCGDCGNCCDCCSCCGGDDDGGCCDGCDCCSCDC